MLNVFFILWLAWSLFCCTLHLGTLFLLLSPKKHCTKFNVQQIGLQVPIIFLFYINFPCEHFPLWLSRTELNGKCNSKSKNIAMLQQIVFQTVSLKLFCYSSGQFGSCSCIWTVSSVLRISIYIWDMVRIMVPWKCLCFSYRLACTKSMPRLI